MTLLEQLQADAAFYVLNILGFLVVVLLTWLLTRSRQAKALAALQQQQQLTKAATNDTFVALQEGIDHELEYLRRSMQLLEQALLEEDVAGVRQQRYQLVHGLMQNYRPKVARAAQLWSVYYQEDTAPQQELVKTMLLPFLETSRQITGAVNAKAVLNALPKDIAADQAFVLEKSQLDFAFRALEACGYKRWAKQYQTDMIAAMV